MEAEGPAEHVVGLVDGEEVQEDEAGLDDEGRGVLVRGGPGRSCSGEQKVRTVRSPRGWLGSWMLSRSWLEQLAPL